MRFGVVGLGRIGGNIARQALDRGHEVVGLQPDGSPKRCSSRAMDSIRRGRSKSLWRSWSRRGSFFIYLPHGDVTEAACRTLLQLVGARRHRRRWRQLPLARTQSVGTSCSLRGTRTSSTLGTSGGLEGARHGACFMAGGDRDAFERVAPLLRDLAVDDEGVVYAGTSGAGHFTKLVHNAIEFGMVQSIAEGVELLERSDFDLDLSKLLETWNHGSVIRSWLLRADGPGPGRERASKSLSTYVEDTGEVKWVIDWASRRRHPDARHLDCPSRC